MSELAADDLDFGSDAAAGGPPADAPAPVSRSRDRPRGETKVLGERGISPIAGRFGMGKGGKALALLGLVAGSGVFLAATWSHPHAIKAKSSIQEPVKQVVDFASVRATPSSAAASAPVSAPGVPGSSTPAGVDLSPTLANPGAGAPALTPEGQIVPALAAGTSGTANIAPSAEAGPGARGAADPKAAAAQQAAAVRAAKLQSIRSAPLLAFSTDVRAATASGGGLFSVGAKAAEGGGGELDQLRRGSTIGLVHAQRLPDRNFLITAGALLPCVLETAMDTSAPGFVTCRITRDVYSDNGGVVLMEKGSRVLGEYRSGFSQGRARIFVLWDRITTPGGVAVDVSSPASDALGRAGFDGKIDSHFWQRFGGALLLTAVSGGVSAAATADTRFANVAQAPNEAAAVALQNSINIPPTLTKPQGAEVGIFVSRDLNFSGVYTLKGR